MRKHLSLKFLFLHDAAAAFGLIVCIFCGCLFSFVEQKANMDIANAKNQGAIEAKVDTYMQQDLAQLVSMKI